MDLGHLSGCLERIQRLLLYILLIIRIEMHVAFQKAERKAFINKTLAQNLTEHLPFASLAWLLGMQQ